MATLRLVEMGAASGGGDEEEEEGSFDADALALAHAAAVLKAVRVLEGGEEFLEPARAETSDGEPRETAEEEETEVEKARKDPRVKLAMTLRSLPRSAATSCADVVTDAALLPVERRQGRIQRLEAGDDGEGFGRSFRRRDSRRVPRGFRDRGIRRRRAASHRLASPVSRPGTSRRRRIRGARRRGGDARD